MALRWTAAGLLEAQNSETFRRLKAYRQLPIFPPKCSHRNT